MSVTVGSSSARAIGTMDHFLGDPRGRDYQRFPLPDGTGHWTGYDGALWLSDVASPSERPNRRASRPRTLICTIE